MVENLSKHIKWVLEVYKRAGFIVKAILMDGEFEKIKSFFPSVECNTTAAKDHVREAEHMIRMLKEWTRGLLATLVFSHKPRWMKIEFVYFIVLWLNAFPVKSRISATYLPRDLLVWWCLDLKKNCCMLPGSYCKVHDELVLTNMMAWCMHNCIVLEPSGYLLQGSVKFYSLTMGRVFDMSPKVHCNLCNHCYTFQHTWPNARHKVCKVLT